MSPKNIFQEKTAIFGHEISWAEKYLKKTNIFVGIGQNTSEVISRKRAQEASIRFAALRKSTEHQTKKSFQLKTKEKALESDQIKFIRQAQKATFDLDDRSGLTEPTNPHFWPPKISEKLLAPKRPRMIDAEYEEPTPELDEIDEDEFIPEILLNEITIYLRTAYFYCIYCGTTYANLDDLNSNCPGNSVLVHDEL